MYLHSTKHNTCTLYLIILYFVIFNYMTATTDIFSIKPFQSNETLKFMFLKTDLKFVVTSKGTVDKNINFSQLCY